MKIGNLEKFFEEVYQLAKLKEDNAASYAEGLHTAIKRNGGFNNFDYKSFNTSRIPLVEACPRLKTWDIPTTSRLLWFPTS